MHSTWRRLALGLTSALITIVVVRAQGAASGQEQQAASRCRIAGKITSGGVPLPGVSVVVHVGNALRAATSTDTDGTFAVLFTPNATYHLTAHLTGFAEVERDVTLGPPPCDGTADFQLALGPRPDRSGNGPASGRGGAPSPGQSPNASSEGASPLPEGGRRGRGTGPQTPAAAGGGRAGPQRFQTLNVETDANGAATVDLGGRIDADEVSAFLPAGFSVQNAQADAIAITGNGNATNLDRGLMNDRLQAINLGQFDPATGQFAQGFGPLDGGGAFGPGAFDGPGGGRGGPGGFGGPGGRGGGPGGRGGFVLGGRGARGQNSYQGSATYTFSGSALDSPPYQLRPDVPVTQPQFGQNNFGATFGGPLKIPGVYRDTNRRTNFQVNYTGTQSNNLFDQYATVPTDAMRQGDFSGSPIHLIDPQTGQPLAGNQIPTTRISPTAASLLPFIPEPNLPGPSQNYHVSTLAHSSSEALSLRVTQNLSPTVPQGRGSGPGGRGGFGGSGGGGFGGGFGGRGGPGGRANGRGTNIMLSGQLQYRRNETQALSVFPNLGGDTTNTSIAAPISLNVSRGRTIQNFTFNVVHTRTQTTDAFMNNENVAGAAGIQYPGTASTDPFNWGVPNLMFSSGLTGLRDASANLRTDTRITTGYNWIHPGARHRLRAGGDYRWDLSQSQINSNARGTFTFTGLYTSGGAPLQGATGADFADFLLGLPQQASLQVGGTTHLREHAFDAYIEDNWQKSSKLTLNLGLRYELVLPYVEVNGHMANLDAAPGFAAIAPVCSTAAPAGSSCSAGIGPYTGAFPPGLLNADTNNLGPRLGFAYRLRPNTIFRGGYSVTYNSGSYASIARELVAQPPFADTETVNGTDEAPLTLADALLTPTPATTNNWGVNKDYALGTIQTWNATITRNLTQDWMIQAGYTGIKGTNLDVLRAPDLGAGGVPIPGTQPFIWESSGGHSIMNGANFQLRRRLAHGFSGGISYTLAKAMDNASTLGAGGPVVAQNDNDLNAEWALSNFDRRQQFSGVMYVELPWGPTRRWLNNGGLLASLFGEWSAQFTLTLQSGTPLTARVLGAATDLLRGVNGSLRANYDGAPISLGDPTVDEFFNITAFSLPAPGQYGDAGRNTIIGPGARQLNGLFQRDVRVGGNRTVTLQVNAVNLLNTVQWATIDTNYNSRTFGEVLSARPMRTITVTARFRF